MENELFLSEEDLDPEEWDDYFDLIYRILKGELTFEEKLDVLTPIWQEQMRKMGMNGKG